MAALSVTNVKQYNTGVGRKTRGQFTSATGDAPATLVLMGGTLWDGRVWANAASGWIECPFSFTATGGLITVTIESLAPVTDGYFTFDHS
jgi:hypothetical protein